MLLSFQILISLITGFAWFTFALDFGSRFTILWSDFPTGRWHSALYASGTFTKLYKSLQVLNSAQHEHWLSWRVKKGIVLALRYTFHHLSVIRPTYRHWNNGDPWKLSWSIQLSKGNMGTNAFSPTLPCYSTIINKYFYYIVLECIKYHRVYCYACTLCILCCFCNRMISFLLFL